MARNRKHVDSLLLAHLAGGASVAVAAKLSGLGERTVSRRMADPDFKRRLLEARAAMLGRALGHLSRGATEAAVTLRKLLRSPDGKIKLGAAGRILDSLTRLRDSLELSERIAALEARVKAAEHSSNGKYVAGGLR